MLKKILLSVLLLVSVFVISYGVKSTMTNVVADDRGWVLKWSDEFEMSEGSSIDKSKWSFDVGGSGYGNNELEYYTDRTKNCYHDGNGNLVIKAYKENYGNKDYTSARIHTKNKHTFTYGKIEMRAKLPRGQGIWPAFWLLGSDISKVGWPTCGEIDVMELVGKEPKRVFGTVHGPGYSGGGGLGKSFYNESGFSDDYHNYTIEWEQNQIRWYVDGKHYETRTSAELGGKKWVFNHDFYIILNLAVGGNWPGAPNSSTVFPQSYIIDYVRVYQHGSAGEGEQYQIPQVPQVPQVPQNPQNPTQIMTGKVALKSVATVEFVCAEECGNLPLKANRDSVGSWEKFEIVNLGNNIIAMKSVINNKYITADKNINNCPLIANRTECKEWESFRIIYNSDNTISLQALSNNLFVSASNNFEVLAAKGANISNLEKFYIIKQ